MTVNLRHVAAGKAGADILFLDPERKSTTVGVTVSPVRIASLEQFGDVTTVGKRLLDAERAKVYHQGFRAPREKAHDAS